MSTHDEEALLRLAGAVGDGTPIDWEREGDAHAGLRPHLNQLRVLEAMIALRSGAPADPPHVDPPAFRTSAQTETSGRGLTPGRVLGGRYEIRTFLGEGGMGEVWLALDLKVRVEVALKTIHRERLGDERALELLRREVRAARQVASPNVCRIFDLVEADGHEFVSMECVDGTTLASVLRQRGPLDLREATGIASQFLVGLDSIHEAGLVHRDIKPGNVMITRTGRVVLMDFGLAKPVTDDKDRSIVGTRPYMAPEQLQGGSLDARTDIFAAGLVLAEMLSVGGSGGQMTRETLWAAVREEPPRLPANPWRPVLLRAIAKDPGRRYPSAQEMARALEEITLRDGAADDRRPYPGLASFTDADAEYFFGREMEVEQMWRKLRWPHLQAVIGPSGAGKSSFLRAGLIPALSEGWRAVVCAPGSSPMMAVAQALAPELSGDTEAIRLLPRFEDPSVVVGLIGEWRRRHEQAILIVDQFEELFTLNAPEAQGRFAQFLARLVIEADVHVLLSMRDDFLLHCHAHAPLAPIFSDLTPLGSPTGPALRRALTQPALKCGYRFEDDALVEEMLVELKDQRGALPLLAFALARLWEKRDRETGLLTRDAYREIGGVGGALAQHAEATLDRVGAERQPVVREIFRNLVTAQGTRAARDRDELLSVFPDRERADGVLRALVDARLLTSFDVQDGDDGGAKGRQRVEIIHESLLVAWPRLVRWQTQDADGAQLRDQLRQAAQLWQERGRPVDLLWRGTSYREFRVWRERYAGGLTATEEAFSQAMITRAGRQRRLRRLAVGAAFTLLFGVVGVIGWSWRGEKLARLRADSSRLFAFGQLEIDTHPTGALAFALASLERADSREIRRFVLDTLARGPTYFETMPDIWPPPCSVDFSSDGRWLAVGQCETGTIALFPRGGGAPTMLSGGGSSVRQVLFGPESDILLSAAQNSSAVRIWSIPDGKLLRTLVYGAPGSRHEAVFISSDRSRLLTVSYETSHLFSLPQFLSWPPGSGDPVPLRRIEGAESLVAVDPTGNLTAYARNGNIYLQRLDESDRGLPKSVGRHAHPWAMAFSPDGNFLASADADGGMIKIWAVGSETRKPLLTLDGEDRVTNLKFGPTGSLLASAHWGATVRVWDLGAGLAGTPVRLPGRTPGVAVGLAFDPTGRWLAVATGHSSEGTFLWPLERPHPRILLSVKAGSGASRGVTFAPDGSWIAATMGGSVLRRWPLSRSGGEPREVRLRSDVIALAADPTGRYLLAGGGGGVELVPLQGGRPRKLSGFQGLVGSVAFSPDGHLAAAGGGYGGERIAERFVRIWNLQAGTFRDLKMNDGVHDLAFVPDGGLVIASGRNLYRWNLEDPGAEILKKDIFQPEWNPTIDLSRDGRSLYIEAKLSEENAPYLYDLRTGDLRMIGEKCYDGRFDPSGQVVVCGADDGDVLVIPLRGGSPHRLVGHKGPITEIAVSPDGRWIASAGRDGTLRLWPMPEGQSLFSLPREQLLERLRSQTNLRAVLDEGSPNGRRWELDPRYPGWETVPGS